MRRVLGAAVVLSAVMVGPTAAQVHSLAFVDQYVGNVKQYRAIAMDVGDQDALRFDATKFHEVMDTYGINDAFEINHGTHTSAVANRFQNHVLPFFSENLCFSDECR